MQSSLYFKRDFQKQSVRRYLSFDGVYPANGRAQDDSKRSLHDAPPRRRGRAGAAAPGRFAVFWPWMRFGSWVFGKRFVAA